MKLANALYMLFLGILTLLILAGCSLISTDQPVKISIIGIDGATWEIINPLIERGELPGFARLKKEGTTGLLKTIQPTESISIWTSIATGVSPTKHGLQTFTRRIPGTDKTIPSSGTDRQVPALWNMVSDHGKKVVSVKWYATWPAETINGAMLSPRLEPDVKKNRTYPPELFKEITDFRFKSTMDDLPKAPKPAIEKSKLDPSNPRMLIGANTVQTKMFDDTSVWEAGWYVYKKYSPDLFMIYLKSIDRVEHFLWGAQEVLTQSDPSPIRVQQAEAIFGWYRHFDSILQKMMSNKNQILFVISDHGMQARNAIAEPYDIRYINLDRILEHTGYLTRISENKTNWLLTRAYEYRALPYDWTYQIRINLEGREPNGIVRQSEYSKCIKDISKTLLDLKTIEGHPVFHNVSIEKTDFDISCCLNRELKLTDIVVYGKTTTSLRNFVVAKGLPSGIHTKAPPGIIAAIGPGIKKGKQITNAHVFDITPTVLYAMGLPVAEDFAGSSLMELFQESFIAEHPMQTIPSYGVRDIKTNFQETNADKRIKDELKALGYI